MRFNWTPRQVDQLKVSEFWSLLEQIDDMQKRESGEAKKYDMLSDPQYEGK